MQIFNDEKENESVLCLDSKTEQSQQRLTAETRNFHLNILQMGRKIADLLKEEYYIRTKTDEFVLKAVEKGEKFNKYTAVLNVEELEGMPFPYGFESQEQTIRAFLNLHLRERNGLSELVR